jgi:hypothetical protein
MQGATDVVMETLAGLEMYALLKASPDQDVQRRLLTAKVPTYPHCEVFVFSLLLCSSQLLCTCCYCSGCTCRGF